MPENIEIKATAREWQRLLAAAEKLSGAAAALIEQWDTFFTIPSGRLKLRQITHDRGELIFYQRPDQPGPKLSAYTVTHTDTPESLRDTLARALGISGEVRKRRWLFLCDKFGGHSRIHLDEVKGLGHYVELEVVLRQEQLPEEGERIAGEIRNALDIRDEDLIECAYVDLITAHCGP